MEDLFPSTELYKIEAYHERVDIRSSIVDGTKLNVSNIFETRIFGGAIKFAVLAAVRTLSFNKEPWS